jgi:hypothetical protein
VAIPIIYYQLRRAFHALQELTQSPLRRLSLSFPFPHILHPVKPHVPAQFNVHTLFPCGTITLASNVIFLRNRYEATPTNMRYTKREHHIVSERTPDSGLISPHLRSFLEDISETVCSTSSMNGNVSKYLYGGSEMMKAQDIISKEVADWLELNENDNYWAPRRQLRQKVSLITNVIQFTT